MSKLINTQQGNFLQSYLPNILYHIISLVNKLAEPNVTLIIGFPTSQTIMPLTYPADTEQI